MPFTRQLLEWGVFVLIVALMCFPFGAMLLTLGIAKWVRNRRQ